MFDFNHRLYFDPLNQRRQIDVWILSGALGLEMSRRQVVWLGSGVFDLMPQFFLGPRRFTAWVVVFQQDLKRSLWFDLEAIYKARGSLVSLPVPTRTADRWRDLRQVGYGPAFDDGRIEVTIVPYGDN